MNAEIRRLLFLGGAVFLVALLLHLPAATVFGWSGLTEAVAMRGVNGTVWSGSASAASLSMAPVAQGRAPKSLYLGKLRWRFQPLSLFLGRIEYLVEADGPAIAGLRGRVSPAGGDGVRLLQTRGRARIDGIAPLIAVPMLGGLTGVVDFDLERVVLSGAAGGGWPQQADGRLRLQGVSVPLLGNDSLGDFEVSFRTDGDAGDVQVEYQDLDNGPLALRGTAVLHADGSVERQCTSSARGAASTALAQAAPLICSNDLF